jgi:stage II sporulation protein D
VIISGSGWGHGVGMAQDGALQMGRAGAGLSEILSQFYPGTALARANGDVRVPVLSAGAAPASAEITFPDGGQLVDALSGRQSPGFPRPVPPGGRAVIGWDGATYSVVTSGGVATAALVAPVPATSPTTIPPLLQLLVPPTTAPPNHPPTTTTTAPHRPAPSPSAPASPATTTTTTRPAAPAAPATSAAAPLTSPRPIWAIPSPGGALGVPGRGRSYRGDLEAETSTGALRVVNQLDVETYLTGMGEVLNPSWPIASLEAQEVAARTYALRAMATAGELCDDTRCQVYLGTAGEYAAAEKAVATTAGEVLVWGGQLADAVYSANAAGFSASREEGFGQTDAGYAYLRAARYPTGLPLTWVTTIAAADAGRLLGLPGPLTAATVTTRGPSGRALQVAVGAGPAQAVISGLAFASALGLKSTLINVEVGSALKAPPPPPAVSVLQILPEATGGIPAPAASARAAAPASLRHAGRPRAGLPVPAVALAIVLVAASGAAALRAGRPGPRRAPRAGADQKLPRRSA